MDLRCPESHAPYYQYRFPVLISDDGTDQPEWLGWFYADACATNTDRAGQTWANFEWLAIPNSWWFEDYIRVGELPGAGLIPDPALRDTLVPRPEGATLSVPGTPDGVSEALRAKGFEVVVGPDGYQRILLDSSRGTANAAIQWWDVSGRGPFYVKDPAGAAKNLEISGGVMRIQLNPVNLAILGAEARQEGEHLTVQVRVANHSERFQTPILSWSWTEEPENWEFAVEGGAVVLAPWSKHDFTFQTPLPETGDVASVEVAVNRLRLSPWSETSWADNQVTVEAPITRPRPLPPEEEELPPVDLVLTALEAPAEIPPPVPPEIPHFPVTAHLTNSGDRDVTTVVRLTQTDTFGSGDSDLELVLPARSTQTVTFLLTGAPAGTEIELHAVLNPGRDPRESNWTNNEAWARVRVPEEAPPHLPPPGPPQVKDVLID